MTAKYTVSTRANRVILIPDKASFVDMYVSSSKGPLHIAMRQAKPPFTVMAKHRIDPPHGSCRLAPGFFEAEGPFSIFFDPADEDIEIDIGIMVG